MFPPRAGQCACVIDGAHTEFLITEYADRVLVVATQIGKLGTVFHLSRSQSVELSDPSYEDDGETMDDATASMDTVIARTVIGRRGDEGVGGREGGMVDGVFTEGFEKGGERRRGETRREGDDDARTPDWREDAGGAIFTARRPIVWALGLRSDASLEAKRAVARVAVERGRELLAASRAAEGSGSRSFD